MDDGKTGLMGILNITPDSFYDGGNYLDHEKAFLRAVQMKSEGADIIDIGGESTRPGAPAVGVEEEIGRICPVIERISKELDILVSVDTTKSPVAAEAVKVGARMINDISGLSFDREIARLAAESGAYLVVMHIRGTPGNMQNNTAYDDLVSEISAFLENSISVAREHGVKKDKIIIDPGIGFGKSLEDNYRLINSIGLLKKTGCPVLIGLSRKSLIGGLYNHTVDRLPGTIALNAAAVLNGAGIIRVHDVKEHRLMLDALDKLKKVS
jgi:dihydropteroate synthase